LSIVSSHPDIKQAVKTNVFVGKFIDEIFHFAKRVRHPAPCKFIDATLAKRSSPVKNHCFKVLAYLQKKKIQILFFNFLYCLAKYKNVFFRDFQS